MKSPALKIITLFVANSLLLASCATIYDAIGTVSLLTSHAIDTTRNYTLLATSPALNKKTVKYLCTENIDQAVNQAISRVPGGCYLTHATIYVIDGNYYAVTGDVWGIAKDTLPVKLYTVAPCAPCQPAAPLKSTASILK
ncbi:MAG TPA: hypothetical protein VK783_01200 [Bacteroidia bacterium]|jgi:hypothetical protein|nr:hypothetical protein [Bacteroidia bacterium]